MYTSAFCDYKQVVDVVVVVVVVVVVDVDKRFRV